MVCIAYSWLFAVSFVSLSFYVLICDNENQQPGLHSSLVWYALLCESCDGEKFEVFFENGKSAQPVIYSRVLTPIQEDIRALKSFVSISNAEFISRLLRPVCEVMFIFSFLPIRLQSKLICLVHKKVTVRIVGELLGKCSFTCV